MNVSDDEEEIKIEYFDSFEVDPLCENITKFGTNDTKISNNPNENINQQELINDVKDCWEKHKPQLNIIPLDNSIEDIWYKKIDSQGRYICKFCDNFYSTIQTVRHHVKTKHTNEWDHIKNNGKLKLRRRKLKCHICKKLFKNTMNLQEHIKCHGVDNILKSCFICHATFNNETEILLHLANEHESVKRRLHYCNVCGYSTPKMSHFKQHENTHLAKKQIECLHCDYVTYHPSNMKIHERIHSNDKPYTCTFPLCSYQCTTKSGLSSHQLQHQKEKKFLYCDKCNYKTVYKQSLKKHVDSHRRNSLKCVLERVSEVSYIGYSLNILTPLLPAYWLLYDK
ncbi:hypothetical protein HW555_010945 [Spodoptera exigua]|uniref:C2H2-type domain-containing protein n=1 Tax=Spodoptera exigua TaxID=7107 RepID=A0A835G7W8_SPOEX|nr:hypothetical protein HW555_010945 [Spodoptera exigua]